VAPFEQGEIGPGLFRHACLMGLEDLVSKHRERAQRPVRSLGEGEESPAPGLHPRPGSVLGQRGAARSMPRTDPRGVTIL
jgi:hypothetical protein